MKSECKKFGMSYFLIEASECGDLDEVNRLLEDPNVDPSVEAIIRASENGYLDVVNRLLEDFRVDPSARGNEALQRANFDGYLEVVKRLLKDSRVDSSGVWYYSKSGKIVKGLREVQILDLD